MTDIGLLSQLGIHGWDRVEPAILAGVLLGEPILLVSEPGSGKTYLGSVLAQALGLKYGYYDTAKANFEDVLGFPNPEAFAAGRADFIHNEITVWDKEIIMVDEVSRASRDTSNKWLEILGSRKLMGKPLPVRVLLGAMNPIEHHGTHALDEAFADRFVLFVRLPSFAEMDDETRERILLGRTGLDAPSLGWWRDGEDTDKDYVIADDAWHVSAKALRTVLKDAAERYEHLTLVLGGPVGRYADMFSLALHQSDIAVEPRRLKMLKRALLATLAVRHCQMGIAEGELMSEEDIISTAEMVAAMSMPHPYTGSDGVSAEALKVAHMQAAAALKGNRSELLLFSARSHAERITMLLEGEFTAEVAAKVCADFREDSSMEADMTALALAPLLLCDGAARLPVSCLDLLTSRYQGVHLAQQAIMSFEAGPEVLDEMAAFDDAAELMKQADVHPRTRLAIGWALGHHDRVSEIEGLYNQATSSLEDAMKHFEPLAVKWDVATSVGA